MKTAFTIIICLLNKWALLWAQQAEKIIKRGNDFYKKQQYEQATNEYQKIQEWDSSFTITQFNLGNTLYRSGKKEEANKIFIKLLANEKDPAQASRLYYNKGVILGSQQKLEESIEEYKNALRKNPDDMEARENLQKALLELKKKTPPKKDNKKNQQQQKQQQKPQPKMNQKEAEQRLKLLEQKEKEVQQRMQKEKSKTGGGQPKDW